ncbi:hypothetical protein BDV19DRAFT_32036 [Aspergillus venezuelensis]
MDYYGRDHYPRDNYPRDYTPRDCQPIGYYPRDSPRRSRKEFAKSLGSRRVVDDVVDRMLDMVMDRIFNLTVDTTLNWAFGGTFSDVADVVTGNKKLFRSRSERRGREQERRRSSRRYRD